MKKVVFVSLVSCFAILFGYLRNSPNEADDILAGIEVPDIMSESVKEYGPPQIIKVASDVYVAIGYAFSTVTMFVGHDGVIIVDTTESLEAATKIAEDFRRITIKPVKTIIYTHHHGDHTNGAKAFMSNDFLPEILAHSVMVDEEEKLSISALAYLRRGSYQFGNKLPKNKQQQVFSGGHLLNDILTINGLKNSGKVPPTRYLHFDEHMNLTIAGLDLTLIHIPGETSDQIGVWYPRRRILLAADDIHKAFPNIYAIRGTSQRDVNEWIQSVRRMAQLRPKCLLFGHCNPVCNEQQIQDILLGYAAGMQYVHDQTVRFINRGLHPHDIAQKVTLPEELASQPYLYELYGTVPWSVRGIYDMYMGWFSGDTVDLNPLGPSEKAKRMVAMAGQNKLIRAAREAMKERDYQWALELSSHVFLQDSSNNEALLLRRDALKKLASLQTSSNGRHFLMTTILDDAGLLREESQYDIKMITPLKVLLQTMRYRLRVETLPPNQNIIGCFYFIDSKLMDFACVHLHKGILRTSFELIKNPSFEIHTSDATFREIFTNKLTVQEAKDKRKIVVKNGFLEFQKFVSFIS